VALATFIGLNGSWLAAPEVEAVQVMLGVAAGEIDDEAFARWIRGARTSGGEKGGG
jgi:death on curing protein